MIKDCALDFVFFLQETPMMSDSVFDLSALYKSLEKCHKEDVEPQPLHIDSIDECIKCKWCPNWAGSQVKRVNQHCKRDKCHLKARSREKEETQTELGVQYIRSFFATNCNPAC